LTTAQVARRLKVTPRKVRSLILDGPLMATRVNGRLLVSVADLAQFLAA